MELQADEYAVVLGAKPLSLAIALQKSGATGGRSTRVRQAKLISAYLAG